MDGGDTTIAINFQLLVVVVVVVANIQFTSNVIISFEPTNNLHEIY